MQNDWDLAMTLETMYIEMAMGHIDVMIRRGKKKCMVLVLARTTFA